MNPRAAINDLHPFQGCPFGLLGTSPNSHKRYLIVEIGLKKTTQKAKVVMRLNLKRRMRDSNPRSLAGSLVFKTSALNHSANSPDNAHYDTTCTDSMSSKH